MEIIERKNVTVQLIVGVEHIEERTFCPASMVPGY